MEMSLLFLGRMVEGEALLLENVDGLQDEESVFMAGAADGAEEVLMACIWCTFKFRPLIEERICYDCRGSYDSMHWDLQALYWPNQVLKSDYKAVWGLGSMWRRIY